MKVQRPVPLCILLCYGCTPFFPQQAGRRIPAQTEPTTSVRFRDVARDAGLEYRWKLPEKRPLSILGSIGNGGAFLDYDGDQNLDILLVGQPTALFQGDGRGHFRDVSRKTGIAGFRGHFLGCAVGDFDGDNYPDVYLSAYRGGELLHNQQGRRFVAVTKPAGIPPQPWGTSCAFADVDGDGRMDLYIANYVAFGAESKQQCVQRSLLSGKEVNTACGPSEYQPCYGALYRNRGSGRFEDVTQAMGLHKHCGKGLGVSFADYDDNGQVDLAVANDLVQGNLFRAESGKFRDEGIISGTAFGLNGKPQAGMGIDWGDYDNDGRPDFVVTTYQHEHKPGDHRGFDAGRHPLCLVRR